MKQAREWVVIVKDGTLVLEKVEPETPLTLEYMQSIVGGYIEIAERFEAGDTPLEVYCNEEGKLMGLPLNVFRLDGEPLVGTLLIVTDNPSTGDTIPLTLEEAQRVQLLGVGLAAPLLTVKKEV
jgi:hypothetical protein